MFDTRRLAGVPRRPVVRRPVVRRSGVRHPVVHALATAALLVSASQALAQQAFDVALREGLLSIRANNASLLELTEAITNETGVNFVITGDPTQTVTTEILDETMEHAIAKLSPNHLLVRDGKGNDAPLTEVVLMLDESGSGASGNNDGFLPSGAPADEVISDDQMMDPDMQAVDQYQESDQAMDQSGFDVNGQPLGPDGLPLMGPDGLPIGPDGMPLENSDQGGELRPQ